MRDYVLLANGFYCNRKLGWDAEHSTLAVFCIQNFFDANLCGTCRNGEQVFFLFKL